MGIGGSLTALARWDWRIWSIMSASVGLSKMYLPRSKLEISSYIAFDTSSLSKAELFVGRYTFLCG